MNEGPSDPRLFELFYATIEKGLEYVRLAKTGKTHIRRRENWPKLDWHESGVPYISRHSEGPKDYGSAIEGTRTWLPVPVGDMPPPDFEKEPEFLALVEYAESQPHLRNFFMYGKVDQLSAVALRGIVGSILDRYVHVNGLTALARDKLLPIYMPIESYLYTVELPIVVVVPILFLKFEPQRFPINQLIWVERLTDKLRLAARTYGQPADVGNTLTEDSATHGLFISGCFMRNEDMFDRALMRQESYPMKEIDTFFAALRISTGYATGYAELLAHPVGWAASYAAKLTPISGLSVEDYPPRLRQRLWSDELPTVTSGNAEKIQESFGNLQRVFATKHSRKVRLAMHRLNLSSLRTTEEDEVLDAMIAMEALLSDDRQEITHKVAMRLAGLYKLTDPSRSEQAFKEMKAIYRFRSKIVHGDADWEKYRQLDRAGAKVAAIDAAAEHLRFAFSVLTAHPTLLDPTNIDNFLLTDKF